MGSPAHLITTITALGHYDRLLAAATGERFNVFQTLGVGRYEARTHTPLLVELLSPDGTHGVGSAFLRRFKDRFGLDIDPDRSVVRREVYIGKISGTSGGRIDITIGHINESPRIIIENKIGAADQPDQLQRYHSRYPDAQIIYLTLDGSEPGEPVVDAGGWLRLLSYAQDIIGWLDECRLEAAAAPLVRETIVQYQNLIRLLTGQNNQRMTQQIIKLATVDSESLLSYFELVQSRDAVIAAIMARLQVQCDQIAREIGTLVMFSSVSLLEPRATVSFVDREMEERNVSVDLQFGQSNHRFLQFGISRDEKRPKPPIGDVAAPFQGAFGAYNNFRSVPWWPALVNWIDALEPKHYADICSGAFASELRPKVQTMVNIVRDAIRSGGVGSEVNATPL